MRIIERVCVIISEPILQWKCYLPKIIFPEHRILVPHDEFQYTQLIGERRIYGKVERGVFGIISRIRALLRYRSVMSSAQEGKKYKPGEILYKKKKKTGKKKKKKETHGSLNPLRSFARRSLHPRTCNRQYTSGTSPGAGENPCRPLPLPPETRAGMRAADLSAFPILRPFLRLRAGAMLAKRNYRVGRIDPSK